MAIHEKSLIHKVSSQQEAQHGAIGNSYYSKILVGLQIYTNNANINEFNFKQGDQLRYNFNITDPLATSTTIEQVYIRYLAGASTVIYDYLNQRELDDFLDKISKGIPFSVTFDYKESTGAFINPTIGDYVVESKVAINNKLVKSIAIGGHDFTDITIDGHTYSFINDITITQQDVAGFVTAHTTWASGPSITPELAISDSDYTSAVRSTPYANALHLVDYTWPATVETKNSVMLTFTDDIDAFYTSSDHFWISKGDTFGADAIKVMSAPWPSQSFKAGETWLFSTAGVPVKVDTGATIDTTAKLKGLAVEYSKSTGIADGESITATVKYDSAIADHLNGGTSDVVYTGLVIANPGRTITEAEVDSYADANIQWPITGHVTPVADVIIDKNIVKSISAQTSFPNWIEIEGFIPPNSLIEDKTVGLYFPNNFKIESRDSKIILTDKVVVGSNLYGYSFKSITISGSWDAKAGETWYFESGKDPVIYAPPATTSANLDITKWPALHPGTKLYTPDLHMVNGKEITLTVQADHGYTVNGGASVDYKYTPSNFPEGTYQIRSGDYTTLSTIPGYNHYVILHDWTTKPGSNIILTTGQSIVLAVNTDLHIHPDGHHVYVREETDPVHSSYDTSTGFTRDFDLKAGEIWRFEYGKNPVKVS